MKRDLAMETTPQAVETGVVIVGGGIAGFILAKQLTAKGVPCIILESGGTTEEVQDCLYTDVSFRRRRYGGATEGRSRCLGGTSVKWGGALMPFTKRDFAKRDHSRLPDWPIELADISPYLETAEGLFGLRNNSYSALLTGKEVGMSPFVAREAKWPSFSKRNVTSLFRDIADGRGGLDVWLNATVRNFNVGDGAIQSIVAFGPEGQTLTVTAQQVVLCAGAIETTRLMLLLDAQTKWQVIAGRSHLGRYFQDHLSVALARIETDNVDKLNEVFGFRFEGPLMRSMRFEQNTLGGIAGFVHVAPRSMRPTGFDRLRDFMRSIQRRNPDLGALFGMLRSGPYLARLVWWRFAKKRLLWPSPAEYDLHFVIEQLADPENQIKLGQRNDILGHPVTEIDWDISQEDLEQLIVFKAAFEKFWHESGFSRYGRLIWHGDPFTMARSQVDAIEGIYHPVGTTRMAEKEEDGVVDRDLRVFGMTNLYLGATSVFPNGGSANPTMTLILLILRLATHLEHQNKELSAA